MNSEGLSHSNVHVIGHSLGGQASGHVGRAIRDGTGTLPARLTGEEI